MQKKEHSNHLSSIWRFARNFAEVRYLNLQASRRSPASKKMELWKALGLDLDPSTNISIDITPAIPIHDESDEELSALNSACNNILNIRNRIYVGLCGAYTAVSIGLPSYYGLSSRPEEALISGGILVPTGIAVGYLAHEMGNLAVESKHADLIQDTLRKFKVNRWYLRRDQINDLFEYLSISQMKGELKNLLFEALDNIPKNRQDPS